MPQALIATGIEAVGGLGGALIQSGANKRAQQAQERATREALSFERERESSRQRERAEAMDMYRRQWDARESMLAPYRMARQALLNRYFPGIGQATLGSIGSMSREPSARAFMAPGAPAPGLGRRITLGNIVQNGRGRGSYVP